MSIVQQLIDNNIVQYGDFVLKSGSNTDIYFDMRSITNNPHLTRDVCDALKNLIHKESISYSEEYEKVCIVGVPTGAVPIAAILANRMNLPFAMIRDEIKEHGLGKQIEGSDCKYVILVEDVITTGSSIEKYADILKAAGREILLVVCILNREAGGFEHIEKIYSAVSLLKISDFIRPPVIQNLMHIKKTKKSNLIIALDDPDPELNLKIIEQVAPYVVGFKMHFDIYKFLDNAHKTHFISIIENYKDNYGMFIIEDRKFADIAVITLKQWHALPESYRRIITAVTVHPICGPDVVEILGKDVGLLLIHQLSTKGNLIDEKYSNAVKCFASKSKNVIGFISSSKVKNAHPYLTFSPGINLNASTDGYGQQWSESKETDFVIVGRGITESKDPASTAKYYKNTFYKQ